jgi:type I restriction enzyme R subunit
VPLSEIIDILNERFATSFSEEDRLFFDQIKEKASKHPQVIQTALACAAISRSASARSSRS